jgi:CHAD domain-containing protein
MAKAKRVSGINCNAPAHECIRLVLELRLEEMCALRDQALDWSDPKGVHDMRVASRRFRGALRDFMPHLSKRRLANCLDATKNIADALGKVRDHDVAIIELEELASKAPPDISIGIQRLVDTRRAGREEARGKLIPVLDAQSLLQLEAKFATALETASAAQQTRKNSKPKAVPAATLTYRDVGRSTILGRLEEFEKLSKSLYHPLRMKPLHDLRIAAKHLRYALELFEQCWEPTVVKSFSTKVAGMQSSLGKLHDCDVWIGSFGAGATHDLDFQHKATTIWLLGHFLKLRTKHLGKALLQWSEWETKECSTRLRGTIHANSPEPSSGPAF